MCGDLEHDAAVEADSESGRQTFDRVEDVELHVAGGRVVGVIAVVGSPAGAQVAVRSREDVEDPLPGQDDDHDTDQDGEPGANDPHAQLGEMFHQRHLTIGVLGALLAPAQ